MRTVSQDSENAGKPEVGSPWGRSPRLAGIRDRQATPQSLVDAVADALNLPCRLDVCADQSTAKAPLYLTAKYDALSKRCRWASVPFPQQLHGFAWMNPPYSDISTWCIQALDSAQDGMIVVGCLPDDRSTRWYQDYVDGQAHMVLVPRRRVNFLHPDTGELIKGNPRATILPVWGPWTASTLVRLETRHVPLAWPE